MGAFRRRVLPKLLLIGVLAGLLAVERSLAESERAERAAGSQVGRFLPLEEAEDLLVAAITLAKQDGTSYLVGRSQGLWRCLDLYGTPVREASVQQLLAGVREAEGIVQSRDPQRAADYGLDTERAWRVTFHGPALMSDPDRDVVLEVEVGDTRPGLDGSYLRRPGRDAVWAVDSDPRTLLDDAPGGVPLLDPKIVPEAWPPQGVGIASVRLERADGQGFSLESREAELSPIDEARGMSPVRWVMLDPAGVERPVLPVLALSYLTFLRIAPWAEVIDPESLVERGIQTPEAQLIFTASDGSRLILVVGPPDAEGRRPVANIGMKCATLMGPEIHPLFVPDIERMAFPGKNPWEPWLKR